MTFWWRLCEFPVLLDFCQKKKKKPCTFSVITWNYKWMCVISRNRDAEWGYWFIRPFYISQLKERQTDMFLWKKNDCGSAWRVRQAAGTSCPSSALATKPLAQFPRQPSIHTQLAKAWPITWPLWDLAASSAPTARIVIRDTDRQRLS